MPVPSRSGTIKAVPIFPRLEGDPPRPPSPSSKPAKPHYNRPQTPTMRSSKGESGGTAMPLYSERAAAKTSLRTTSMSKNTSGVSESATGRISTSNRPIVEGDDCLLDDTDHPLPGDSLRQSKRVKSRPELSKQRSNYFDGAFMDQPVSAPLRDSFQNDGIIVAELITNVFINDDWTICHELAQLVARRYDREDNDIMVSVQHGICYFFQGCFSPAYVLTLSLQPTDISPAVNRRNAAILQAQLHEAIGVHPQRGVIKFVPMPDDCLAWNGMTVTAAMAANARIGAAKNDWDAGKARRRLSVKSLSALRSRGQTPTPMCPSSPPPIPELARHATNGGPVATCDNSMEEQSRPSSSSTGKPIEPQPLPLRQLKPKKSFVANLFARRTASKAEKENTPMP